MESTMLDFAKLQRTWKPNQYLVLPPGFVSTAKADRLSPVFDVPPARLIQTLKSFITQEPRTELLHGNGATGQIEAVARSKLFRFPDYITAQAFPAGDGKSALAVYSRAKYGIRDFGVNRARVEKWLAALQQTVAAG